MAIARKSTMVVIDQPAGSKDIITTSQNPMYIPSSHTLKNHLATESK